MRLGVFDSQLCVVGLLGCEPQLFFLSADLALQVGDDGLGLLLVFRDGRALSAMFCLLL